MKKIAPASQSSPRSARRVHSVSGIVLNYEGQPELTFVRSPDVSTRGMFVNTTRQFPEGAILNVRFRLALTGAAVQGRGEVRYCLPGVGIGLEFIGLDSDTRHLIEREVALNDGARPAYKKRAGARKSGLSSAKARDSKRRGKKSRK